MKRSWSAKPGDENLAAEVAGVLLAHDADLSVRNSADHSPADAARTCGLDEGANLMEAPRDAA